MHALASVVPAKPAGLADFCRMREAATPAKQLPQPQDNKALTRASMVDQVQVSKQAVWSAEHPAQLASASSLHLCSLCHPPLWLPGRCCNTRRPP
jgi:hypothetical protein